MFAVPGWKISASLKKQIAPNESKGSGTINTDQTSAESSKKRKRGAGDEQAAAETSKAKNREEGKHDRDGKKQKKDRKEGREQDNDRRSTEKQDKSQTSQRTDQSEIQEQPARPGVNADEQTDGGDDGGPNASSKRRERRKKQKELRKDADIGGQADEGAEPAEVVSAKVVPDTKHKASAPAPTKLTPLQSAMRQKLISSRFRHLNETLYTTPSAESAELFRTNPTFFTEYHEGFARQVEGWPENPVDGFVNLVLSRSSIPDKGYQPGKVKGADKVRLAGAGQSNLDSMGGKEPLPRDFKSRISTIADLGCGSGSFAQQLDGFTSALHLNIHSFDLASPNEHVKIADIRSLPLPDSSVDVVVFSLALMGTNWIEFIEEAWRILRWKGECWVADVNSRFAGMPSAARGRVEHSVGNRVKGKKSKAAKKAPEEEEEKETFVEQNGVQATPVHRTDVSAFVDILKRRGFAIVGEPDVRNKMFARMRFTKSLPPTKGKNKPRERKKEGFGRLGKLKFVERGGEDDDVNVEDETRVLKPCVYKTR